MPPQLEAILLRHLSRGQSATGLLFANKRGRPYSANKLRGKQLHPLLRRLGIPRGAFMLQGMGQPARCWQMEFRRPVVQKQMRHSDARITLGIYGHVVGNAQRDAVE